MASLDWVAGSDRSVSDRSIGLMAPQILGLAGSPHSQVAGMAVSVISPAA